MKNSLAPINRIPPEILSLIPDYFDEAGSGYYGRSFSDKTLIALTHVCHVWRDTFISRSSLWTRLDSKDIDKTHTYIQRSPSSPLTIDFGDCNYRFINDDAFALVIPHVRRLKSLTIIGAWRRPSVLRHLRCRVPFLEELDIHFLVAWDSMIHSSTETSRRCASYACQKSSSPRKTWQTSESSISAPLVPVTERLKFLTCLNPLLYYTLLGFSFPCHVHPTLPPSG